MKFWGFNFLSYWDMIFFICINTSKPCEAIQRKLVDIFEILHKFRLLNVLYILKCLQTLDDKKNRIKCTVLFLLKLSLFK